MITIDQWISLERVKLVCAQKKLTVSYVYLEILKSCVQPGVPEWLDLCPHWLTSVVIWQVPATLAGGRGHRSGSYTWGRCATQFHACLWFTWKEWPWDAVSIKCKATSPANFLWSLLDPDFLLVVPFSPSFWQPRHREQIGFSQSPGPRNSAPSKNSATSPAPAAGEDASGAGWCLQSSG